MIEVILLALLGVVTLVYFYLSHNYNYWRRKGLIQPPTVLGFGNILDAFLMRKNLGLIYDEIYRSYPHHDAVGVYGFYTPKLMVRSPDLIKRVMVSDFSSFHDNEMYITKKLDPHFALDPFCLKGEEWKESRSKLTSVLTPTKIKETFPLIKEIIPRLDAYIDEHLKKDVEAKELATLFTMDNVSSTVFGITSNCFTDPEAAFRKMGDIIIKEQLQGGWKAMAMFLMPRVRDLIGLRFVPTAVNDYVEKIIEGVLEYRLKNNQTRNDFFNYFMKKVRGNHLNELYFYGMTFFLEGFETSAMTASKTLYELAMNPSVQHTLYEEIRDSYGDQPDIDFDTVNSLHYLDKVIQESQRKYPVMFAFIRECTKTIILEIDGKPVEIACGTPVVVPVFSLHHDPRYFPDPGKFDPERFNEENKCLRPQYVYMPFGEGPRMCPGIKFGLAQVKLFIVNIVLKYKILRSEKTPQKITFTPDSFLPVEANEELWIRIEKRNNSQKHK